MALSRFTIDRYQLERLIRGAQTEKNILGRRRIANGELLNLYLNNHLSEVRPFDNSDFVIVDDVLSKSEGIAFCEAFRSMTGSVRMPTIEEAYWAGRVIFAHDLIFRYMPLALKMRELCVVSARLISDYYQLQEPIFADAEQIIFWPNGMYTMPHADNANADGTRHRMYWRMFSSILYLNDDFDGGELYFTTLNKVVRPRPGRLACFTSGFHHEHALLKIRNGSQYVISTFFTDEEDRADEFLYG